MPSYELFGGVLRSPIEFPELGTLDAPATWELDVSDATPPPLGATAPIGDDSVYGDVKVRAYRSPGAHHLIYDDTGRFDVVGGSRITWFPGSAGGERLAEAARADIIGRVLALALHQQGILCLHASAVSVGGQAVAMLAPKMHGKSTLAAALVRGGARLLSDDTVPVVPGNPVLVRPGVHQLRLWRDAALELATVRTAEAVPGRKVVLDRMEEGEVERGVVPFGAAYVLVPAHNDDAEPARRTRLSGIQSTLALVEHSKLGPLLGGPDAALMFEQAAAIARSVPIFLLRVARDLDRVGEAAAIIRAWHTA
jgi:hypothetical protein